MYFIAWNKNHYTKLKLKHTAKQSKEKEQKQERLGN